jgi:hypothetical protein
MVVDVLGRYGPLFFSTRICTSYYFVFSINLVEFVLSECLGMSRNVSECTPKKLKMSNDHMNLLHAVQIWKLNAVHKWWTAVNWRDFVQRGVSPFLNGNSWFVKQRLSPPCFKRRLQPWPACVDWFFLLLCLVWFFTISIFSSTYSKHHWDAYSHSYFNFHLLMYHIVCLLNGDILISAVY